MYIHIDCKRDIKLLQQHCHVSETGG